MAALSSAASVSLLATTLHRHRLPPPHLYPISLSFPTNNHPLKLSFIKPQNPNPNSSFLTFSSLNPPPPPQPGPNPTPSLPTKTLAALFALAAAISAKLAAPITAALLQLKSFTLSLTPDVLQRIQFLQENVLCTAGPLFFATLKNLASPPPSGYLNTPLVTAIASGVAKWLDIYSGVLMVRVLLSWFPNVPWERQPLSAIRDLCDPYLSLFRNVFPPVLGSLDVSPLAAFTVLGVLASILNTAKKVY